jgi:xanthine dehydrogenase YagS FAD-binding subunit
MGAIANVPYQVEAANQFLEGKGLEESTADRAAEILLEKPHIFSDNAYKLQIARALIRRTLMQLKA